MTATLASADLIGNGAEEADDAAQPAVVGEFGVGHAAEGGAAEGVDDGPFEAGAFAVVENVARAAVDSIGKLSVDAVDVRADLIVAACFRAAVDVVSVLRPNLLDHR